MMEPTGPFHFLLVRWWWIDTACLWWINTGLTYIVCLIGPPWAWPMVLTLNGLVTMAAVAFNSVRINFAEQL